MVSEAEAKIPHALDRVIDFVNTLDPDEDTDALATAEGAQAWLVERGLLDERELSLSEPDREAAVALREALRALMLANNGGVVDPAAAHTLDGALRGGQLGMEVGADGTASLVARAEGIAGALAKLVVPLAEGAADGSWRRVKACRADDCQWAFYDRSRNRSGVWCSMAVCGNRAKVRAYRGRAGGHDRRG